MPFLTTGLLAGFAAYLLAWYADRVEGNFSLLMFVATVVTGMYWAAERWWFLPQRRAAAQALQEQAEQRMQALQAQGIAPAELDLAAAREKVLAQPWWLDWTAGLFPVVLVVFLLRSFVVEPFRIPSGSMLPTLEPGDLILVNKFGYGLRLPVLNTRLTDGHPLQRGDVVVFRYPPKPSVDFIKRVVGLPGDEVAYINKQLTVNGKAMPLSTQPDYLDRTSSQYFKQFSEQLDATQHQILRDDRRPAFVDGAEAFEGSDRCTYSEDGVRCKVPAGHYFMMGDNRDNSLDSRYWGFVPDDNIVGKAVFIWMNFSDLGRIGSFK